MKTALKYTTLLVLLFLCDAAFSQTVISGATCVMPNTIYQYIVSGNEDSTSQTQVCINQGSIVNLSDTVTCESLSGKIMEVFVMWNDSTPDIGSVKATAPDGNASLAIHFAGDLLPGSIDSASKSQIINFNTLPAIIRCSPDSGGSCAPLYSYQWQSSFNMISWVDITSANDSSLVIDSPLTESTFYRRQVTELTSGSIGYSDAASVLVVIPQTDSTSFKTDAGNQNKSEFIALLFNRNKAATNAITDIGEHSYLNKKNEDLTIPR